MNENFPDPRGHFVSFWCSEMDVENEDGHTDAEIRLDFNRALKL